MARSRKKCTGARYQAASWKYEYTGFSVTGSYEHQPSGQPYHLRLLVHQAGFHLQAWLMAFVPRGRKKGQEVKAAHLGYPVYSFSMDLRKGKSRIGRSLHFEGEQWQIQIPDEKMSYDATTKKFKEHKDAGKPPTGKPCRFKVVYRGSNSITLSLNDGQKKQKFKLLTPPGPEWPYTQLLDQTPTYKWWMLWGDFLSAKDTKAYYTKLLAVLQQLHRYDKKKTASWGNKLFSINKDTAYRVKLKQLGKQIYDLTVKFEDEFGGKGKYPHDEWDFALGYIKYHLFAIKHHRYQNYWYFFLYVLDHQTRFKGRKRFNFIEYFGISADLTPHQYEWTLEVSKSVSIADLADLLKKLGKLARAAGKAAQFFPEYKMGKITIRKVSPNPWPKSAVFEFIYGYREVNLWNSVLEDGAKTATNTLIILGRNWTPQDFIGNFEISPTLVLSSGTQFLVNFQGNGQHDAVQGHMKFKKIEASFAVLNAGVGDILQMKSGPAIHSSRTHISQSKIHNLGQQSQQVSFKYNAYCLSKAGKRQIRQFLAYNMRAFQQHWTKLQFDGHASSDGKPAHNLRLSRNRATEVYRFVQHILLSTQMSQRRTRNSRYRKRIRKNMDRYMSLKAYGEAESGKDAQHGKTAKWRKVDIRLNGRLMVELFGK